MDEACANVDELLSGYLDDELTQKDRQRVDRHDEGCARWRADGLRAIGVFEDKAFVGEGVHVRRLDPVVAIARHGVGALLVGDE